MNSCGNCTACCTGAMEGEVHGIKFGNSIPCNFLKSGGCRIYEHRPESCRSFYCAYALGIVPGLKNPVENGFFVGIFKDKYGGHYAEVFVSPFYVDHSQLELVKKFVKQSQDLYLILNNVKTPTQQLLGAVPYLGKMSKELANKVLEQTFNLTSMQPDKPDIEYDLIGSNAFKLGNYQLMKRVIDEQLETLGDVIPTKQKILTLENMLLYAIKTGDLNSGFYALDEIHKLRGKLEATHLLDSSVLYTMSGDFAHGEKILDEIIDRSDEIDEVTVGKALFNKSIHYHRRGEFKKGMYNQETYIHFMAGSPFLDGKFNNLWDGEIHEGMKLIVTSLNGYGDDIINVRFILELQNRGVKVLVYFREPEKKSLGVVFERMGIPVTYDLPEDKTIPMVNMIRLAYFVNPSYDGLWKGRYIFPQKKYTEKWKSIISTDKKIKIGVRWRGNPNFQQDKLRHIDLKDIYDCIKHLDAEIYSLQAGEGIEQLQEFPNIIDLSEELFSDGGWENTIAAVDQLDVIITSDTSIAHVAGAQDKETYVFVPQPAYHIWNHNRERSPWYGENTTDLHQENSTSWKEPFDKLKSILNEKYS